MGNIHIITAEENEGCFYLCSKCLGPVHHLTGQGYRLAIHLVEQDIPKNDFAKFARVMDSTQLWTKEGRYQLCFQCERMLFLAKDYVVYDERTQNDHFFSIIKVPECESASPRPDGRQVKGECVYEVEWVSPED